MAVDGYVLIETDSGSAKSVARRIGERPEVGAALTRVDVVTGPFDVIAQVRADDLDALGRLVSEIRSVSGVRRTTTCVILAPVDEE